MAQTGKLRHIPGAEAQVLQWFVEGQRPSSVARRITATYAIPYTKQAASGWRNQHAEAIATQRAEQERLARRRDQQIRSKAKQRGEVVRERCDDPHCPCKCYVA